MKKYIDADKFKEKYLCCGYLPEMSEREFDEFEAADVVSVVRCRDCDFLCSYAPDEYRCYHSRAFVELNDFCNYGKKKWKSEKTKAGK